MYFFNCLLIIFIIIFIFVYLSDEIYNILSTFAVHHIYLHVICQSLVALHLFDAGLLVACTIVALKIN